MILPKILIVDDDPASVDLLEQELEQVYETRSAGDGEEALAGIEAWNPDLILLDVMMPKLDGIEVVRRLRANPKHRTTPVIMLTAKDDVKDEVTGLDAGADDYIVKPFRSEDLHARIRAMLRIGRLQKALAEERDELQRTLEQLKAAEVQIIHLRQEVAGRYRFEGLIGKSAAMCRVYDLVEKVIPSNVTVILTGETGTGKELIARCIHYNGDRKGRPFVTQNCGALPEGLLESELFGHRKGAFTDAVEDKPGLFEVANGGTIFLDEVGEMSPAMQVRLLRTLQEREIRRVGETTSRKVDVRVITATNRDLERAVAEGSFREDLYYRLNVFPIHLPPLRHRKDDVPALVAHFLERLGGRIGRSGIGITTEAMDRLCSYTWPGNVRELENEIERALVLVGDGRRIDVEMLSEKVKGSTSVVEQKDGDLRATVEVLERERITETLKACGGNRTRAAKLLKVSRWGLIQKIQRYGITG